MIEILFGEICNLYGDAQNAVYLKQTLPGETFIETPLDGKPYFLNNTPNLILLGGMSEHTQRKVIEKLKPFKDRIKELIDAGTVFLCTGNAGEIFTKHISYVTEKIETDALGLFNLTVKTDWFKRYNGKVLGTADGVTVTAFRSSFSFIYGDNSDCYFLKAERGCGINPDTKLEGMRRNNLICTSLLGPLLPVNPLFTEYLLKLAGYDAKAAFRSEAMDAYEQRLKEFRDPKTVF